MGGYQALASDLLRIYWHVSGEEGQQQILKMPASSYVVAMGYEGSLGTAPEIGMIGESGREETQLLGNPKWLNN